MVGLFLLNYYFEIFIFGKKVIIKMPKETITQPYKAHNFWGHSGLQVDNTMKFLILQATSKAPKATLNLFAHKIGKQKNSKETPPM